MASQRYRLDIDTAAGGVPSYSTVVYAQTAGAAAGFVDIYFDNTDVKSVSMMLHNLEVLKLFIQDNLRTNIGGV